MSPTPEASERQRKAAYKAWETIRRKKAGGADSQTKPDTKVKAQAVSPRGKQGKNGMQLITRQTGKKSWPRFAIDQGTRTVKNSANVAANVSNIMAAVKKSIVHGLGTEDIKGRSKSALQ